MELNAFDVPTGSNITSISYKPNRKNNNRDIDNKESEQLSRSTKKWKVSVTLDVQNIWERVANSFVPISTLSTDKTAGTITQSEEFSNVTGEILVNTNYMVVKSTQFSPLGTSFNGRKIISVFKSTEDWSNKGGPYQDAFNAIPRKDALDWDQTTKTPCIVIKRPLLLVPKLDAIQVSDGKLQDFSNNLDVNDDYYGQSIDMVQLCQTLNEYRHASFGIKIEFDEKTGSFVRIIDKGPFTPYCAADLDQIGIKLPDFDPIMADKNRSQVLIIPKSSNESNFVADLAVINRSHNMASGTSRKEAQDLAILYLNTTRTIMWSTHHKTNHDSLCEYDSSAKRKTYYKEYLLFPKSSSEKSENLASLLKLAYFSESKRKLLSLLVDDDFIDRKKSQQKPQNQPSHKVKEDWELFITKCLRYYLHKSNPEESIDVEDAKISMLNFASKIETKLCEFSGLSEFMIESSKFLTIRKQFISRTGIFGLNGENFPRDRFEDYEIKFPQIKKGVKKIPNLKKHLKWLYPKAIRINPRAPIASESVFDRVCESLPLYCQINAENLVNFTHKTNVPKTGANLILDPYFHPDKSTKTTIGCNYELSHIVSLLTSGQYLLDRNTLVSKTKEILQNLQNLEEPSTLPVSPFPNNVRGIFSGINIHKNERTLHQIHLIVHSEYEKNSLTSRNDGRDIEVRKSLHKIQAKLASKRLALKIGNLFYKSLLEFHIEYLTEGGYLMDKFTFQDLFKNDIEHINSINAAFSMYRTFLGMWELRGKNYKTPEEATKLANSFVDLMACGWYTMSNFILHDIYLKSTPAFESFYDWETCLKFGELGEGGQLQMSFNLADELYSSLMDRLVESIVYMCLDPKSKRNVDVVGNILSPLYYKSNVNNPKRQIHQLGFFELMRDLDGLHPLSWSSEKMYQEWRQNLLNLLPMTYGTAIHRDDYEGSRLSPLEHFNQPRGGGLGAFVSILSKDGVKVDTLEYTKKLKRENAQSKTQTKVPLWEVIPTKNGSCMIKECKTGQYNEGRENHVGNASLGRQYLSYGKRIPFTSSNEWTPFVTLIPNETSDIKPVIEKIDPLLYKNTTKEVQKFLQSGKYFFFEANEYQIFDGGNIQKETALNNPEKPSSSILDVETHSKLRFLGGLESSVMLRKYPLTNSVVTLNYKDSVNKMLMMIKKAGRFIKRILIDEAIYLVNQRNAEIHQSYEKSGTKSSKVVGTNTFLNKYKPKSEPIVPWQHYQHVSSILKDDIKVESVTSDRISLVFNEIGNMKRSLKDSLKQKLELTKQTDLLDPRKNNEWQYEWHVGTEYKGSESYISDDILCLVNCKLPKSNSLHQKYTLWLCCRTDLNKSFLKAGQYLRGIIEAEKKPFHNVGEGFLVNKFDTPPTPKVIASTNQIIRNAKTNNSSNADKIRVVTDSMLSDNIWKEVDKLPTSSLLENWKVVESEMVNVKSNVVEAEQTNELWNNGKQTMDYALQPTLLFRIETVIVENHHNEGDLNFNSTTTSFYQPCSIWNLKGPDIPKFGDVSVWSHYKNQTLESILKEKIRDIPTTEYKGSFPITHEKFDIVWAAEINKEYPSNLWKIPLTSIVDPLNVSGSLGLRSSKYSELMRNYSIKCKEMNLIDENNSIGGLGIQHETLEGEIERRISFMSNMAGRYKRSIFQTQFSTLQDILCTYNLFATNTKILLSNESKSSRFVLAVAGNSSRAKLGIGHYDFYLLSNFCVNKGLSSNVRQHEFKQTPFQFKYRESDHFWYNSFETTEEFSLHWVRPFMDQNVRSGLMNSCDGSSNALFDIVKSVYSIRPSSPTNEYLDWRKCFNWSSYNDLNSSSVGGKGHIVPTLTSLFSAFDIKHMAHKWWVGNLHVFDGNPKQDDPVDWSRKIWTSYYMSLDSKSSFKEACSLFSKNVNNNSDNRFEIEVSNIKDYFRQCLETELLLIYAKDRWSSDKFHWRLTRTKHNVLSKPKQQLIVGLLLNPNTKKKDIKKSGRILGLLKGTIRNLVRLYFIDIHTEKKIFVSEFSQFCPNWTTPRSENLYLSIADIFNSSNRDIIKPCLEDLAHFLVKKWIKNLRKHLIENQDKNQTDDHFSHFTVKDDTYPYLQILYKTYLGFKAKRDSAILLKMTTTRQGRVPDKPFSIVQRIMTESWKNMMSDRILEYGSKFESSLGPILVRKEVSETWLSFWLNETKKSYKDRKSFCKVLKNSERNNELLFHLLTSILHDDFTIKKEISSISTKKREIVNFLPHLDSPGGSMGYLKMISCQISNNSGLIDFSSYSNIAEIESKMQARGKIPPLLENNLNMDSSNPKEIYFQHELAIEVYKYAMEKCSQMAKNYRSKFNSILDILGPNIGVNLGGLQRIEERICSMKTLKLRRSEGKISSVINMGSFVHSSSSGFKGLLLGGITKLEWRKMKEWSKELRVPASLKPNLSNSMILQKSLSYITTSSNTSSNDHISDMFRDSQQIENFCRCLSDTLLGSGVNEPNLILKSDFARYMLLKIPSKLDRNIELKLSLWTENVLSVIFTGSILNKGELLKSLLKFNFTTVQFLKNTTMLKSGELNFPSFDPFDLQSIHPSEKTFQHFLRYMLMPLWIEYATLMAYHEKRYKISFDTTTSSIVSSGSTPAKKAKRLSKFNKKRRKITKKLSEATSLFMKYNNLEKT